MASTIQPIQVVARDETAQSVPARWATVRVRTNSAEFVGRVLVPATTRNASTALRADRQFVFLTQVCVNRGPAIEPFVAISRRYIKAIAVLHESAPEALPVSVR